MGEELPSRPFFPVQEEVRRLFQELIHQPWGGQGSPATGNWPVSYTHLTLPTN